MKAYPSNEHGTGMCIVPESGAEESAVRLLLRMRVERIIASYDERCGVIHFTMKEPETSTAQLAEAFYTAARSPGMRPWNELMPSERTGIAMNVEKFLAHLEAYLKSR